MTPMGSGSGLMGRFEQGYQEWEGPPRQGDWPRGAWSLEKQTTDDVGRLEREVQRETGRKGVRRVRAWIRRPLMAGLRSLNFLLKSVGNRCNIFVLF